MATACLLFLYYFYELPKVEIALFKGFITSITDEIHVNKITTSFNDVIYK